MEKLGIQVSHTFWHGWLRDCPIGNVEQFLGYEIVGPQWAGGRICFECDNEAVVSVVRTGKTRDKVLAAYVRNICILASIFDINLVIVHLPGVSNTVADLLSRWDNTPDNCKKFHEYIPYGSTQAYRCIY